MRVQEIMTRELQVGSPEWTVGEAITKLHHGGFRHLPIVEADRLVGLVSERDVRSFLLPSLMAYDDPDVNHDLLSQSVSVLMVRDVVSVGPELELAELIDILLDNKIGAVPVIDPQNEELVGIVSYSDVLRAVQDLVAN